MNKSIDVRLISFDSDNLNHRTFADITIDLIIAIVNNEEFQNRVISSSYSRSLFQEDNNTYIEASKEKLLNLIITGKEYKTQPNDIIELQVKLEVLNSGVIGGMTPPNPIITTNTDFFNYWMDKKDYVSLAAHWIHEW